jgi:hypothetical protein
MKITVKIAGDRYDDLVTALREASQQADLNDLDKMRAVGFVEKQIVTKYGVHTVRYDLDTKSAKAQCPLAPAPCSAAGVELEICPDCRGLCGKANKAVTIFTPCQTCGGNGSIVKAKPQPNIRS